MMAPLSASAHVGIKVKESCNCCAGFFSKKKKEKSFDRDGEVYICPDGQVRTHASDTTVTVTDEVFHRTIVKVTTPESKR